VSGTRAASGHSEAACHRHGVGGENWAVAWEPGTKAAGVYALDVPAGAEAVVRLRLTAEGEAKPDPFAEFEAVLADRRHEADEFYAAVLPAGASDEQRRGSPQADARPLLGGAVFH